MCFALFPNDHLEGFQQASVEGYARLPSKTCLSSVDIQDVMFHLIVVSLQKNRQRGDFQEPCYLHIDIKQRVPLHYSPGSTFSIHTGAEYLEDEFGNLA